MHTKNEYNARDLASASDSSPSLIPDTMSKTSFRPIRIKPVGDVVLHFRDHKADLDEQYLCSRDLLRQASPYFEILFDPKKFNEGREVEGKLKELYKSYKDTASIPLAELPIIVIQDVGAISAKKPFRNTAIRLFLKILHGQNRTNINEWDIYPLQAIALVTLLAILADRFSTTTLVAQHVQREDKKLFEDRKKDRGSPHTEINRRQRLLTGMLLGFPDWVRQSSAALICEGSKRWVLDAARQEPGAGEGGNEPLWWRLPHGMEEELQCRREFVLETISSLPSHFIGLYTRKQLQCKLGYGSSPQCDSFQLGEMVRFFTRRELLSLQSTYALGEEPSMYAGDVNTITEKLRQCPSYQLDSNHRHCGLRTRLIPLLDTLWPNGQTGVCLKCWDEDRSIESWSENPTRGMWIFSKPPSTRWENCRQHCQLKAMYTADERNWTPSPS